MDRLKKLRQSRKLTQMDLAVDTRIPIGSIQHYERKGDHIPAYRIYKLAKYFNVTADYLLGWDDLGANSRNWLCPKCGYQNKLTDKQIKKYEAFRKKGGDNDWLNVYCQKCMNRFLLVIGSNTNYYVKEVK